MKPEETIRVNAALTAGVIETVGYPRQLKEKRQRTAALQKLRQLDPRTKTRSVLECGSPLPLFLRRSEATTNGIVADAP
ncbi:MAG: hypothetical protein C5B50_21955 [Verrucomicrobia bacterium]|nr:MAG: hypothetical protein C5B50_21955 [Verrucomicrobiota bacterium]